MQTKTRHYKLILSFHASPSVFDLIVFLQWCDLFADVFRSKFINVCYLVRHSYLLKIELKLNNQLKLDGSARVLLRVENQTLPTFFPNHPSIAISTTPINSCPRLAAAEFASSVVLLWSRTVISALILLLEFLVMNKTAFLFSFII